MDTAFPLDLAMRASNLSERMQIVDALSARGASVLPGVPLSAFDLWKTNKLASKLAGQSYRVAFRRGEPEKQTEEYLLNVLTIHKLCELNLQTLDDETKSHLTEVHHAWLPTYQHALQAFDRVSGNVPETGWQRPEIYYGKFARACEPFLVQLHRELSAAYTQANASLGIDMFGPHLIEDIQNHLLQRFELALAWAIEADANVYCTCNGIEKTRASSDDYIDYVNLTFLDKESYHHFFLRFPTLGRWLAQITRFLCDNGRALIERLRTDIAEISDAFFGKKIVKMSSFKSGKSDYHAGGQSVVFVGVELLDTEQGTFVYKPRCLQSEAALQEILQRLASEGVIDFVTSYVIPKDGYGYAAFIPSEKNHVGSSEEAGRIYAELGGFLALFYILGGSDIHFENLLVADGHAFICDGETVLGILPFGQERPLDSIRDSVYKTGLIEWPRIPTADAVGEMRLSGYAGGEAFQIPFAQPRINKRGLSFELAVEHEVGIRIDPDAANRVYLDGQLVQPADFKDWILRGFTRVHDWFRQNPSEAIQCVSGEFKHASVRFVSWSTQIYTQLLLSARHPKCLMEPLEVDLIINDLREHLRRWDQNGLMAECELSALWRLDIPMFTVKAQSKKLVHDYHTVLPMTLEVTPLEYVAERIQRLSPENHLRQIQYITASLSSSEVQSPSFIAAAMDYAQQVGWQLCNLLRTPSERSPWKSYQLTPLGAQEVDIQPDLYSGTAGIALFLATLDALAPQRAFRQAAERALSYSIAFCDREKIGAFQGLSGLIYVLIHLQHLWKSPQLLDLAIGYSRDLASGIEQDREFDVFNGAAGVIPIMIGLSEASAGEGLDCAHRCARHLLQHAERTEDRLSWPSSRPEEAKANLTGFAHGTSGIGWALISLGCATNRPDYIAAGRQAFVYEALHFDESEQDWYDLRTRGVAANKNGLHFANAWCNGAAGIGLSRITSWAMLGKNDDNLLNEACLALAATLRNFHKLGNDTPCHGKAGNAELFLRFAQLKGEPAFQMEANVQAQAQWRNFEKAHNWIFGGIGVDVFPGLMIGLAGIGMHFLRLAYPDQVPSPLLLDPPTAHREQSSSAQPVSEMAHTR